MRLLLDECCDRRLQITLIDAGHDVVHILDLDPSADDGSVLARALTETRILITHDYDFGALVVRDLEPSLGVILVGKFADQESRIRAVRELLSGDRAFEGHLTVLEKERIRQRPIPRS